LPKKAAWRCSGFFFRDPSHLFPFCGNLQDLKFYYTSISPEDQKPKISPGTDFQFIILD